MPQKITEKNQDDEKLKKTQVEQQKENKCLRAEKKFRKPKKSHKNLMYRKN